MVQKGPVKMEWSTPQHGGGSWPKSFNDALSSSKLAFPTSNTSQLYSYTSAESAPFSFSSNIINS